MIIQDHLHYLCAQSLSQAKARRSRPLQLVEPELTPFGLGSGPDRVRRLKKALRDFGRTSASAIRAEEAHAHRIRISS